MLIRTYHIQMHTPLGSRTGTLEARIDGGRVRGVLEILKHAEPFEGSIDEDGRCSISGTLVTLMNAIPYTAAGWIRPDSLYLLMKGGKSRFSVTGTASRETPAAAPIRP